MNARDSHPTGRRMLMVAPWLLAASIALTTAGCKKAAAPLAPAPPPPPPVSNTAPEILSLTVDPTQILYGHSADVTADARDADGDGLTYSWSAGLGTLFGSGNHVVYSSAACCAGSDQIRLTVTDSRGASASATVSIVVTLY